MGNSTGEKLGWWVISGEALMEMLQEVKDGGDVDLIYMEHYANSDHEHVNEDGTPFDFAVNFEEDEEGDADV
jgi:hypothetical protein